MFVFSVLFKREKDSEWEKGFYIGSMEDPFKSVRLDIDYKPIDKPVFDLKVDMINFFQIKLNN